MGQKFKVGDQVVIIGQRDKMTVASHDDAGQVRCIGKDKKERTFSEDVLEAPPKIKVGVTWLGKKD